jgi:hypothetical protein
MPLERPLRLSDIDRSKIKDVLRNRKTYRPHFAPEDWETRRTVKISFEVGTDLENTPLLLYVLGYLDLMREELIKEGDAWMQRIDYEDLLATSYQLTRGKQVTKLPRL